MEKKELTINRRWIKAVVISFILSFASIFLVEHFGKFYCYPKETLISGGHRLSNGMMSPQQWGWSDYSFVSELYFVTPLDKKIDLNPEYIRVKDVTYKDGRTHEYDYSSKVYLKAVWSEIYLVFLLTLLFLLLYWFSTKFKLKIR